MLDEGLRAREFLLGDRYTVADVSLYAYAHVAGDAGIDMAGTRPSARGSAASSGTPGFVNDLEPYPPNATRGRGGESVHG